MINYRRGNTAVSLLTVMLVLMAFAALVGEYMRIHTMQTKVEQQLIQASNVALEAAMHDSYRQDHEGYLDEQVGIEVFYSYLHYDMGLDTAFNKYDSGGQLLYSLEGSSLDFIETPPAITFTCTLRMRSIFSFFADDIVVPFNIRSKNGRLH